MASRKEPPRISPAEAEVLAALGSGEKFGLQLVDESDGRIKRGSVYVLLGRLEERGLLSSRTEPRSADEGGLPRRLYRLSAAGRRAVDAWQARVLATWGVRSKS